MTTWWLAIDEYEGNATYGELQTRRVIAQGWPDLGDLAADGRLQQLKIASPADRPGMLKGWLQRAYPDGNFGNIINNITNFFCNIQPGDFIVGRPGQRVMGICEVPRKFSYSYDANFNYAHGFGPVTWHDWTTVSPDWTPAPPALLHGVARVGNDRDRIEQVFRRFLQRSI